MSSQVFGYHRNTLHYKCSGNMKAVLYITLVFTIGVTCEPHCSKYAYEEKLLERMIQVQFDVKQFANRLDTIEKDVRDIKGQPYQKIQDDKVDLEGDVLNMLDNWKKNMTTALYEQQKDASKEVTNALNSLDSWKENITAVIQEQLMLNNELVIRNMTSLKGTWLY